MKKLLPAAILVAIIAVAIGIYAYTQYDSSPTAGDTPQDPAIGAELLLTGYWSSEASDAATNHSLAFAIDGGGRQMYREWLNDRLTTTGTWSISGDQLTITVPGNHGLNETNRFEVSSTMLTIYRDGSDSPDTYVRVPEQP